jgi:hypothetical protein
LIYERKDFLYTGHFMSSIDIETPKEEILKIHNASKLPAIEQDNIKIENNILEDLI